MENINIEKPSITFPCEWEIKLIGSNEVRMREVASDIISDRTFTISASNKSRTGKYISLKIKVTFLSAEEKDILYRKFNECKDIKFVL